ncbi:MAG: histidinol-phosphate transaminase [Verrucomicrobiota bacterium]
MNPSNKANPWLENLVAYDPGKPIEETARELGLEPGDIIKLASNENPLGPSPKAVEAMKLALEKAHLYPDGGGYALRTAIAEKFDLQRENVILGNGSNEIIELVGHGFLQPGDDIIAAEHAFVVYKLMATLFGANTIEVPDPGFVHDLDAMAAAITPKTRELFIANPNNPTGTLVDEKTIDRFMDKVPEHVIVIFDEAYYEFLSEAPDTLKYVREGRNVIVMRTFSKIQGLASLRIGYGLGPTHLLGVLQKCRQPFNANAIAQAGALAGLLDDEHQQKTKSMTDEGRDYLEKSFGDMGLEYVPSEANFVLVKVGDGDAVFQAMLQKGLIVRAMRSYKLPDWIRISVGTMEQNRRCIEVLGEVLA